MKFVKIDAGHESCDAGYVLSHDDGTPTEIHIQDATEYGAGYIVVREGLDDQNDPDSWFIQEISGHRTLSAAQKSALKALKTL